MKKQKEGFYRVTLLAPLNNCTRDDMTRYKDILFRHMKRYANNNGLQFEVYGCFTNAPASNHMIGTPHFSFVVYGVGASTIAQEMCDAWVKRWPNTRGISGRSKACEKGRIYDLCNEKEGGWLGYIKKNYRMAADGLHGWACCSFGLTRKTREQQEKLLCLRWDESEQKQETAEKRTAYRQKRKEKDMLYAVEDDSFDEFDV
ncbi:hypothetical protein [Mitsuokella jalaludinii]|uniref:hypothetical protein n=1 Tax=Mitsuokella jalaludinii TaxID=187979 RepID=UPI0030798EA5